MASADLDALVRRLEAAATKIEAALGSAPAGARAPAAAAAPQAELSKAAQLFRDQVTEASLAEYVALSAKLGGLVHDHAQLVAKAVQHTERLIDVASRTKKPSDWPQGKNAQEAIAPIREALEQIGSIRDKNRTSKQFSHLTAVADGAPAFGWVVVDPKPAPYVSDMKDAAQFYLNRVIKEHKDTSPDNVAWAQAWAKLLGDLLAYVKQAHTTGLVWSFAPTAGDLASQLAALKGTPAAAAPKPAAGAGGPPPPPPGPPPPPPPMFDASPAASSGGDAGGDTRNALFAELNRGSAVTSGLRKVDPSMQTHKNPSLRAGSTVPDKAPAAPAAKPAAGAAGASKKPAAPASMSLQGNKWVIENFVGKRDLVVEETTMKTVVYMYNCTDCAVEVKGKVNSVTLDGCRKSAMLLDSAVSTVDIVNGKSVQLQVTGAVPTIAIDASDSITLYLGENALGCEILTAKSSEINVMLPPESSGGDMRERPVPEQFKTTVDAKSGALITVPVEHKG